MEEVSLMEVRALTLGIAGRMYKPLLSGIIFFLIFSQKEMGVLAPGSVHSRPSAWAYIFRRTCLQTEARSNISSNC